MRCFLEGLQVVPENLILPENRKGKLYFLDDEVMTKDTGTMYMEFEDSCYYDEMNDILCFGNPYLQGETVEFVSNTYAVICKGRLIAVFMKIPFLKEKIVIRDGRFHGKLWENTTGNSVFSMVTDSFKKIREKFISKFEK